MDDNSTKPHIPQSPSLYAKHEKVYPQRIAGTFRRIKWLVLGVLLGLYYVVPWIRWDRGMGNADQAVLADIAGRRLYFFNIEIWPQEIYYLTGILVLGAIGLEIQRAFQRICDSPSTPPGYSFPLPPAGHGFFILPMRLRL